MVIAGVIFYKQRWDRFEKLIRSFQGRVDAVVFLDGPYAGLSDDLTLDENLYQDIHSLCLELDVQCVTFPPEVYDGEPSKRTAAAQAARLCVAEGYIQKVEPRRNECLGQELWYLVIDSDEWIDSDIDWERIEQHGKGTISLHNWEAGDWSHGVGDGASMVRIMPLLSGLVWGPAHYDVQDVHTGVVFCGHSLGLSAKDPVCARFGHDVGVKVIAKEYENYNDNARVKAEGKLLRISEVADDQSHIVLRMDKDQALAEWKSGMIATFPQAMVPEGFEGDWNGMLDIMKPVDDNPLIVEMIFLRVPPEDLPALMAERNAEAEAKGLRDQERHMRRKAKKARKAARAQRISDSQRRHQ